MFLYFKLIIFLHLLDKALVLGNNNTLPGLSASITSTTLLSSSLQTNTGSPHSFTSITSISSSTGTSTVSHISITSTTSLTSSSQASTGSSNSITSTKFSSSSPQTNTGSHISITSPTSLTSSSQTNTGSPNSITSTKFSSSSPQTSTGSSNSFTRITSISSSTGTSTGSHISITSTTSLTSSSQASTGSSNSITSTKSSSSSPQTNTGSHISITSATSLTSSSQANTGSSNSITSTKSSSSSPQTNTGSHISITSTTSPFTSPITKSSSNPVTMYQSSISWPVSSSVSQLRTDEITSPFWVKTGCNINITADISFEFLLDMERKLSNAYDIGFKRSQIVSGRFKRATTNGVNTLQLVGINRVVQGQLPANLVYYVVTSPFNYVPPLTVINNMNQLSLQELSVYLGVPVTSLTTFYNANVQNSTNDQKFWIIGVIFGSLAGIVFIIWSVLFLYSKCTRSWEEPLIGHSMTDLESGQSSGSLQKSDSTIYSEKKNLMNTNRKLINEMERQIAASENINMMEEIEKKFQNDIVMTEMTDQEELKRYNRNSSFNSNDSNSKFTDEENNYSYKLNKVTFEPSHVQSNGQADQSAQKPKKEKKEKKKKDKEKKKKMSNEAKENLKEDYERKVVETIEMNQSNTVFESPTKLQKELTKVDNDRNLTLVTVLDQPMDNETVTSLIEVKPQASSSTNAFEVIRPVPFVNYYESQHIFPKYSDECIVISDTSLNLIKVKETNELSHHRDNVNTVKPSKSNLRTLTQLPLKPPNRENQDSKS